MSWVKVSRDIDAPVSTVFHAVADINVLSQALPHIVNVEFLTETKSGVGTRFRETRLMRGKEYKTELEVTEYVENDHVRLVADSGGTVWDSVFKVARNESHTRLRMAMDARAHKLLSKIMNFFIQEFVERAVENDMDLIKAYCEKSAAE